MQRAGSFRSTGAWLAAAMALLGTASPDLRADGSRAAYERAGSLRERTRNRVYRAAVRPHWSAGGNRFWYRNDLAEGAREFVHVDAVRGVREPAFDHRRLAEALAKAAGRPVDSERLPFDAIEIPDPGDTVRFHWNGKHWRYHRERHVLEEMPPPQPVPSKQPEPERSGRDRSLSPDGRWRAIVRDHGLFLHAVGSGEEAPLAAGTAEDAFTDRRLYWSPDSRKLAAVRVKRGGDRRVAIVESSPRDQLQPKLHTFDYLKPGDPIPHPRPRLFDVAARAEIPVPDDLFPNPWSVEELRWAPDSGRFTFLYNQRGHQVLRVIAVDAVTGKPEVLVDEQSRTFIDYAYKRFTHYLDATGELLWMSERDGWNHLYLYDARRGKVKNQVTRGEWVVRGVDRVDPETRRIWFRAGGLYPDQDPYYIHYCRINFDGTGLVRLTEGDGTHALEYSPDGRFYLDTWSRVDLPPVTELRLAADGRRLCELERADWSALLATGWRPPERFSAKGRDGKTDIYGVIHRPAGFDPARRYPVIEEIYAGPHGSFVPKAFRELHGPQALAELGFILVQIDGMGTSNRSKAFHDVCWKNLGDSGFPDRILWMQAAARKYPSMDLSRVGIYGGSAGGQSAMRALLAHPEFYRAAVATCGCHDNRMDKIWWNELWMGWPLGPHYEEQSNVTQAHRLQGKLLLIVGELDRNVDPASTMQVVNALIRADKDFDLLVIPGGGHGIGGPYGTRRQQDFFVRHLLGREPRWEGEGAAGGR